MPVPIRSKKQTELSVDEHPRPQTTLEGLQSLKSVFTENGLVTAGSASVNYANVYCVRFYSQFLYFRVFVTVLVQS